jgi:hypothetical protein
MLIYPLHASRSSNGDISGSLDEQDRFCIKTCSSHLETTAESLEKNADDAKCQERPNASKASKKANPEQDVILVTSSGVPPESNCHVSMPTFLI